MNLNFLTTLNWWPFIFAHSWFHGSITRDEAEHLLQPREDGLFLVRESTNFPGDYTLCVCFQGKVEHYRVKYLDNKLTIDDEEYFENLGQLVAVSVRLFCSFLIRIVSTRSINYYPFNLNQTFSYSFADNLTIFCLFIFAALRKGRWRPMYPINKMLA